MHDVGIPVGSEKANKDTISALNCVIAVVGIQHRDKALCQSHALAQV